MNIEKFVDKEMDKRPATFFCRESIIDLVRDAIAQDRKEWHNTLRATVDAALQELKE